LELRQQLAGAMLELGEGVDATVALAARATAAPRVPVSKPGRLTLPLWVAGLGVALGVGWFLGRSGERPATAPAIAPTARAAAASADAPTPLPLSSLQNSPPPVAALATASSAEPKAAPKNSPRIVRNAAIVRPPTLPSAHVDATFDPADPYAK
jgi:hypothetical protein